MTKQFFFLLYRIMNVKLFILMFFHGRHYLICECYYIESIFSWYHLGIKNEQNTRFNKSTMILFTYFPQDKSDV